MRRSSLIWTLGVLVAVGAESQSFVEIRELELPGVDGARLGHDISIDGDLAVAGAPEIAGPMGGLTRAVIYSRNAGGPRQWGPIAEVQASDFQASDRFGWAVDIDDGVVVVGASLHSGFPQKDPEQGTAYVFIPSPGDPSIWVQRQRLRASDGEGDDWFGHAVSIDKDTLAISAYMDEDGSPGGSGSVYVFERGTNGTWVEVQKLAPFEADVITYGFALQLDGRDLYVATPSLDVDGIERVGGVYWYRKDEGGTWQLEDVLLPPGTPALTSFGSSIRFQGDRAIVGATGLGADGGFYTLQRPEGSGVWNVTGSILTPSVDGLAFGSEVALDTDTTLAGDPFDDTIVSNAGQAILYRLLGGSWTETQALGPPDLEVFSSFGIGLAVQGGTVMVGASTGGIDARGRVHVFEADWMGGSVRGGELLRAFCTNVTTGQGIAFTPQPRVRSVDCDAEGLVTTAGDEISLRMVMRVIDQGDLAIASEIGASVFGASLTSGRCTNRTTPDSTTTSLADGTSWDCVDRGLEVAAGDIVQMTARGVVD